MRSHPKYFKFSTYRHQTLLVYTQLGNVGFHPANDVSVSLLSGWRQRKPLARSYSGQEGQNDRCLLSRSSHVAYTV